MFVDATNLEKLIAASVPKGEAEAAIEAQKEMTPYFGVAGANPSGGTSAACGTHTLHGATRHRPPIAGIPCAVGHSPLLPPISSSHAQASGWAP